MSETVVEVRPRPRDRLVVRLSGGRSFTVPKSATIRLEPGSVLADEDVEELSRIDQYLRGKDKALKMLSVRARSRHEIEGALSAMEIAPAIRALVLGELAELGLVDDERFACEYALARAELKHMGPHRIGFELEKLGVAASTVHRALREAFPAGRQEELAWALVRRKVASGPVEEKEIRRVADLLRRKGFDYGVIHAVAYALLRGCGGGIEWIEATSDEQRPEEDDE